jgi:hypothetical protein
MKLRLFMTQTGRLRVFAPAGCLVTIAALVSACGGGSGYGSGQAPNVAPSLSPIAAQTIPQDTPTAALTFTVSDDGSPNDVTLTALSSDSSIVTTDGIVIGGTGANRTVTITPLEDATGQVNVTLVAKDAKGLAFNRVVAVNVTAVQRSVTAFTNSAFAQMDSDTPAIVSGFTFVQDADDETTFNSLLQ